MAIQETIKRQMDKSIMGSWTLCLYEMFKGDKDRVLDRMILICQERFFYNKECEDYILELVERV